MDMYHVVRLSDVHGVMRANGKAVGGGGMCVLELYPYMLEPKLALCARILIQGIVYIVGKGA